MREYGGNAVILRFSIILLSLLFAGPVSAVTYTWTDDRGAIGFTEDLGTVPKKYRKKARILGEEDNSSSPAVESGSKKDSAAPVRLSPEGVKKKSYGGKDEAYWIQELSKARDELQRIRAQIEAINARLSNTAQMSRSEFKSLENTKRLLEEQESAARKQLDKLLESAGKAGVPPDLR